MRNQKRKIWLIISLFTLLFGPSLFSQKMVTVKGKVVDADTKEPIPFADVYFLGTTVGTTTDLDGKYEIGSKWGSDTLVASFLSYEPQYVRIDPMVKSQRIFFSLESANIVLKTAEVKGKKKKYTKRKKNPAVALWKKVIAHKDENRPQSYDYYEFDKYEKVELDLNSITEKFRNKKAFRKFKFIFDYVDTSELNGKPFLPIYLRETSSKVYYRKNPKATKEYRSGIKVTGMEDYVDTKGFTTVTDLLYRNIDIYKDNILIFDKQFKSPLAGEWANLSYRFYIIDTIEYNGRKVIDLKFTPVNKQNVAFEGDLYILADSTYAVIKADFGIPKRINLNFVNDLKLVQEFTPKKGVWVLSKDKITVDFSPSKKGMGFYAKRSVLYKNHLFNNERENSVYLGTKKVVDGKNVYKKDAIYWDSARQEALSKHEAGVYRMIDTLQTVPAFRTTMDIITLLVSGYKAVGPVDIGPVGAFYSFNDVEGFRLRLGGQTNLKFNPKLQFEGYAAYGFKDQELKYAAAAKYSFKEDFKGNPRHYFRLSYQHDTKFVGQDFKFVQEDNFALSFKRGESDRLLFLDKYIAEYFLETVQNLSWKFTYTNTDQRPLGSLRFDFFDQDIQEMRSISHLDASELGLEIRFAPNEQFLQQRNFRTPIFNKYPVFTFDYKLGIKNLLGGDFNYQRVSLNIFKRFYLSLLGNTRFEFEIGKIWANGVPYFLLHLPRANQTFAYRTGSFNMMNFMEFANDKWAFVNIEHSFEGFFFNKIPLLRKLKLRELITFKAIYGSLDDDNNPNKNPELIQFITNDDGQPVTFTLDQKPYMEGSIGVYNIFKIGRIDLVKRLNYLGNPDIPSMFGVKGLGIRAKIKIEF